MNAPAAITTISALKAWRKRQLVWDPDKKCRRTMRITDVPAQYGIPWQTWNSWEQPVGHKDFKRPNDANMARVVEITGGAVGPADFYAVEGEVGGARHPRQPEGATGG